MDILCDYCLEPIIEPGVTQVCLLGDEHKFHKECVKKATSMGCYIKRVKEVEKDGKM